MRGGSPAGRRECHLVAAIFDAASRERITDATVTARVAEVGLAGREQTLEPMEIAGTTTYGGFFNLAGAGHYAIRVMVSRPGHAPVGIDFTYDHLGQP